jgi:hypothetical protein
MPLQTYFQMSPAGITATKLSSATNIWRRRLTIALRLSAMILMASLFRAERTEPATPVFRVLAPRRRKQINAPVGKLGLKTLTGISTLALKSDDATYVALENKITDLTKRRNEIAGKMIVVLENAAFYGKEIDTDEAEHLIDQAEDLLESID